jgi:hypothetical protein
MEAYEHFFTVWGTTPFPIDMLRYDCCWPATAADSLAIERSIANRDSQAAVVRLMSRIQRRHWRPAADRWRTFGWRMTEYTRVGAAKSDLF